MSDTIFTKIINREIPAQIVYEDDDTIAFLDIKPVRKGHLLLVSKQPYEWLADVPDDVLARMSVTAKHIAQKMQTLFGCERVLTVIEGREVPHFHIHLIPIMIDSHPAEWNYESYEHRESELLAAKISAALSGK
jgi:histidine triad (HIT) family protein